jgi:hypothetical protein
LHRADIFLLAIYSNVRLCLYLRPVECVNLGKSNLDLGRQYFILARINLNRHIKLRVIIITLAIFECDVNVKLLILESNRRLLFNNILAEEADYH